eukprot:scaffold14908_cov71-Skeletonema_dohrnii-CCMP3373.AAC.1
MLHTARIVTDTSARRRLEWSIRKTLLLRPAGYVYRRAFYIRLKHYYCISCDESESQTVKECCRCRTKLTLLQTETGLLTNQSMYPGLNEAMLGETTLSRGSDCDAVWFSPRRMKTPIVG